MTPRKPNTQYEVVRQLDEEGCDLIVEMGVSQHKRKQDLSLQRNDNAQVGEIYAMIKALNKPQD